MVSSLSRRTFLIQGFWSIAALALPAATTKSCAVCGMDVKPGSRGAFQSGDLYFCGFSCAVRYRASHAKAHLFGHDFETGKKIDAAGAFFLVKSKRLLTELEFGMPPPVAVFASRESATRHRARLGDGEVVKGFEEALKTFQ